LISIIGADSYASNQLNAIIRTSSMLTISHQDGCPLEHNV